MKLYLVIILILLLGYLFLQYKKKDGFTGERLDVAVIVEPREHEFLVPVVNNIIDNVPEYTKIQIFHGTKNLDYIKKHFDNLIKSNKIILTNLNVETLTINDYNLLLTSSDFWNKINKENILIFQTDSCMCSKSSNKIEEFLKYDYVGAPWKHLPDMNGGNGGFSLRKKSKMLEIISKNNYNNENEDVYFSKYSTNTPNRDLSKKFSVEGIYYDFPIGIHKPWVKNHLSKKDLNKLKQNCPEISSIFNN
jgi:hypothetical protein